MEIATEDVHLEEIDTQVDDIEETDVILEEPDPHIEVTARRSTREKKQPKQFESYVMHQVTSSSVDKRVQTL